MQVRKEAGVGYVLEPLVANVVLADVEHQQVLDRERLHEEHGALALDVVRAHLQHLQLLQVADQAHLLYAFLLDFVHVQLDCGEARVVLAHGDGFEAHVADLVDAQVEEGQLWEGVGAGNCEGAFVVDVVAGKVQLFYVPQAHLGKEVADAGVRQVVLRELQIGKILKHMAFSHCLQISDVKHCVFAVERANVRLQYELCKLFKQLVLLVLLEQEIQVDRKSLHILVVVQDLLKKVVFELLKKAKRLSVDLDLLCPFEELHSLEAYLVQRHSPCCVRALAQEESFFVDAAQGLYDLFCRKEGENADRRPNAQTVEYSPLGVGDCLELHLRQ